MKLIGVGVLVLVSWTARAIETNDGGLAYWAFLYYHPKQAWTEAPLFNRPLEFYLKSKIKSKRNFCLIVHPCVHLGPVEEWPQTAAFFANLFKEKTYQKVAGNRPLISIVEWVEK